MQAVLPSTLSTSTLNGNKVLNLQGERLGDIEDFVIDLDSGRIIYAVLAQGGFLGMGEDYFAIPWDALTVDTTEHAFRLDVSKEWLKNSPGFDKDNWPSTANHEFTDQVYNYYGYEPYSTFRTRTSEGGFRARQVEARRTTTMDVVDADRNGV